MTAREVEIIADMVLELNNAVTVLRKSGPSFNFEQTKKEIIERAQFEVEYAEKNG